MYRQDTLYSQPGCCIDESYTGKVFGRIARVPPTSRDSAAILWVLKREEYSRLWESGVDRP
eukprot:scaffold404874_cov18-Prasinocladus_malaysianus.AAC.1